MLFNSFILLVFAAAFNPLFLTLRSQRARLGFFLYNVDPLVKTLRRS